MKAVRIHQFGGPSQTKTEQAPIPDLKRGEVLVKIHAAGVNPVDWMTRDEIYVPEGIGKLPITLGQDFSGVITELGTGRHAGFSVGDEVFGEAFGSFAEYVAVPAKDLVKKPKNLSFEAAAALPMPGLTAWQVVIDTAKAARGKRFLIHGAGGPVGALAAQFAILKGAEVIATASPPSFHFLKHIGVHQIIDYKSQRFEKLVRNVDVVIDPVGGDVQARSFQVLKKGGMLIHLLGEIDRSAAKRTGVKAVDFGMSYDTEDLAEIAKLVSRGRIDPHITQVLPLSSARRALDLNQKGRSHGKIVLRVA